MPPAHEEDICKDKYDAGNQSEGESLAETKIAEETGTEETTAAVFTNDGYDKQ